MKNKYKNILQLNDKKILFIGFMSYFSVRIYFKSSKNACSEIIGIFKFSAFSRLLGPILSPATK